MSSGYSGTFSTLLPPLSQVTLGVLFVLGFLFTQVALEKNTLQKTTLFQRLSLLIPIFVAIFFLNETYSLIQTPGFILAIVAIYLLSVSGDRDVTLKFRSAAFLLFLVWLINGCIDSGFMLVSSASFMAELTQMGFLFPIFIISTILTAVVAMFRSSQFPGKWGLFSGIILGIANVASVYFFMDGLEAFEEDAVFVTLNHCGVILLAGFSGKLLFREVVTRRMWLGTIVAIIAIIWLTNT